MSTTEPVLEAAATQAFADATAHPPFLRDLGPVEGHNGAVNATRARHI